LGREKGASKKKKRGEKNHGKQQTKNEVVYGIVKAVCFRHSGTMVENGGAKSMLQLELRHLKQKRSNEGKKKKNVLREP